MRAWRLNAYSHEIVTPDGVIVARLRISKSGQLALDSGNGKVDYSGGSPALGYHVTYQIGGRDTFPAAAIECELHYFSDKSFDGCTVRPKETLQ